ncbi:OLC1v1022625C1 [Oldenlandia corymbosa var. corymbosa]|uniref:OLC1v1022625C1 n=1 Tax=Oldenlandia corymbosa var. corymbosa TaxID=529605 RepID=A0AAV1C1Y0_OLDCO|nr:OLC1v1022625C1 [Oldenlandia corymbosa var. corymbosa]
MAGENEPAKLLLPYLQRADELQKHEPLVAYYCRLYAMEKGLKIPQSARTKTTNALLVSLMNQLEKDKKSVQLGPDDHLHLEGFALNVFAKADKQDRAGRADLNTAKTFYAASIFFEIMNQFGEIPPDLEQKQKYAVWKAADIRKALKEGRKPVPGPPGGEQDLTVPSDGDYDIEPRTNQAFENLQQRKTDASFQDIEPRRTDPNIGNVTQNDYPAPPRIDPVIRPTFGPDSSSQPYDKVNYQQSPTFPPSPPASHSPNMPPSHSPNMPPSHDYPSQTYQPPSTNGSENYPQPYHHQTYPNEAPQHLSHHYSHDAPSYSYPNFQSYPSFAESSLPTAPSHYPSYYQGADTSYSTQSAPSTANYSSNSQPNLSGQNGGVSEAAAAPAKTYKYDSNYQPPPEKIAEAHKAARFAVGALAFDDVAVAVDHLIKSLELLTNPSSGH